MAHGAGRASVATLLLGVTSVWFFFLDGHVPGAAFVVLVLATVAALATSLASDARVGAVVGGVLAFVGIGGAVYGLVLWRSGMSASVFGVDAIVLAAAALLVAPSLGARRAVALK